MAGVAKDPFELDQRPGSTKWRVRFSYAGERYAFSTGKTDKGEAREEARKKYRETIERVKAGAGSVKASISTLDAVSEWKAKLPSLVAAETAKEYGYVGDRIAARWKGSVADIDESAIAGFCLDRLGEVTRESVRKERVILSHFLTFCLNAKWISYLPKFPPLPKGAQGNRQIDAKDRIPIPKGDVEKLLKKLEPGVMRDYYTTLWDTAWRPATVQKLDGSKHVLCYGPRGKKGGLGIWVNPEIEKSRNATRGKKWAKAWVPLPDRIVKIFQSYAKSGIMFGEDRRREDKLKVIGLQVLGREVLDYDFKHSRITAWFGDGKPPAAVSYMSGVALDTLVKHYLHTGEEAARGLF